MAIRLPARPVWAARTSQETSRGHWWGVLWASEGLPVCRPRRLGQNALSVGCASWPSGRDPCRSQDSPSSTHTPPHPHQITNRRCFYSLLNLSQILDKGSKGMVCTRRQGPGEKMSTVPCTCTLAGWPGLGQVKTWNRPRQNSGSGLTGSSMWERYDQDSRGRVGGPAGVMAKPVPCLLRETVHPTMEKCAQSRLSLASGGSASSTRCCWSQPRAT